MKEYDRGSRSRVHTLLGRYNGSYEYRPMSLPSSHRLLTLFVRLGTESGKSFLPIWKPEKPNINGHLPSSLLVFATTASSEDFHQRMIDQVERYARLKPEAITPEWKRFAERNRAEIDRLSPLITFALACPYPEAS